MSQTTKDSSKPTGGDHHPSTEAALRRQRIRNREDQLLAGSWWKLNDWVPPSTVGTPLRETHLLEAVEVKRKNA